MICIYTNVTRLEKRGHFAAFPNFGFKMLTSPATFAANQEPRLDPVWAGRADVSKSITFENCRFMLHFGGSLLGESLKNCKKTCFAQSGPFLISYQVTSLCIPCTFYATNFSYNFTANLMQLQ